MEINMSEMCHASPGLLFPGKVVVLTLSRLTSAPPSFSSSFESRLHAEQDARSMAKQILFLSVALCTLVGVTFLLSYLAATMAQTTRVVGSALVAAGVSDDILQSHPAEEGIPVALCPLLSAKDLGRVKELTVSNLGYFDANDEYHLCASPAAYSSTPLGDYVLRRRRSA